MGFLRYKKAVIGLSTLAAVGAVVAGAIYRADGSAPQSQRSRLIEVVEKSRTASESIRYWAKQWNAADPSQSTRPEADAKLDELLASCGLRASEQFSVAQIVEAAGDPSTAIHWYRSGIAQARAELSAAIAAQPVVAEASRVGATQNAALAVVGPLLPALDSAYRLQMKRKEPGDGRTLLAINDLFLTLPSQGSNDLRRQWARINHAHAQHWTGHLNEASQEAKVLREELNSNPDQFTPEQQTAVHWLSGELSIAENRS